MPNKGLVKHDGKFIPREERDRLVKAAPAKVPAVPDLEERFQSSEDYKRAFNCWMQRCQEYVRTEVATVQKQLDEFRRQVADLFHHWASVQKAQLVQQEDIFEVACMADTTKVLCYSLEDDVARLKGELAELQKQRHVSRLVSCLVMRNVAEVGEEGDEELRERVIALLFTQEERDTTDPGSLILKVTRLGNRRGLGRPRLLLVTCSSVEGKKLVKRRGYKLRSMRASIDHALTLRERQHRAAQWPLIQAAKAAGLGWSWDDHHPDRLVVHAARKPISPKATPPTSNSPHATPSPSMHTRMDITP
jgi:hypothetical protein